MPVEDVVARASSVDVRNFLKHSLEMISMFPNHISLQNSEHVQQRIMPYDALRPELLTYT